MSTNSVLNRNRKGLDGPGARHPEVLARLVASLRSHPELQELDVVAFLENVASSPSEVLAQYSSWLQQPLILDASTCGWASRRRAFWMASATKSASPRHCKPPSD